LYDSQEEQTNRDD